jgi:hypothetical protein
MALGLPWRGWHEAAKLLLVTTRHKARISTVCAVLALIITAALPLASTFWWRTGFERREGSGNATGAPSPSDHAREQLAARIVAFEAAERLAAETVWGPELMAQAYGRAFETLWDTLNSAPDKLRQLAAAPLGEVVLGRWDIPRMLPHALNLRESAGAGSVVAQAAWPAFVEAYVRDGWELSQVEFRHLRFDAGGQGRPRQSRFAFTAHLVHAGRLERASLDGPLVVDWAEAPVPGATPAPRRTDASALRLLTRLEPKTAFQPLLTGRLDPLEDAHLPDPLIVYDLDDDGRPEILLVGKNVVYRWQPNGAYVASRLLEHAPGVVDTALIADLDGDGTADLLCATAHGLVVFQCRPGGVFDQPGRSAWAAQPRLDNGMVLTCGDVDRDGDLDVFLGQYRVPTIGQVLRPHYYDALDGHPAYLLLNEGHGNFTDATQAAGLGPKRHRRVFSASFVDFDRDGPLDLLVVSDFAGVDLYRNDGRGRFADVTRDWVSEPHGFGMAHALADFDADGRLDFLMIGMNSPTVDRLEHAQLWRSDAAEARAMRAGMTYGNRLFQAQAGGGFVQTGLNTAIARSGWSWGCGAADFDNDGFVDVYIANGHESQASVRDYESEFWLHDTYVGAELDAATATAYFTGKHARTRGQGWSYGGYERNRLYLNQGGASFLEAGHAFGVALSEDSRAVVAEDIDGDGGVDLLVTTAEVWPERKHTLRVFANALPTRGHWIRFRFHEDGPGASPVGVRVTLHQARRSTTRHVVTGDSFRSQHPPTVHFGLGAAPSVDRVEVRWPDGRALELASPEIDRVHDIRAPPNGSTRSPP